MSSSQFLIPLGTVSTNANLANNLGHEVAGGDGRLFRLVKASATIGSVSAAALYANGKLLKWTTQADRTVEGASANTDRVCCVVPDEGPKALASGDYFYGQVKGRFTGKVGSAASDQTTAQEYVFASTDADLGKLDDGGTTFSEGATCARALSTSTTPDADVVCEICGILT